MEPKGSDDKGKLQAELFYKLPSVKKIVEYFQSNNMKHLKELLKDKERGSKMRIEMDNFIFDYSHQNFSQDIFPLIEELVKETNLIQKIKKMFGGERINKSENRPVHHMALRALQETKSYPIEDSKQPLKNAVVEVKKVLEKIKEFSERVRKGQFKGYANENLTTFVVIGIGGSYLGPEFIYEAMKYDKTCLKKSEGLQVKFIANVDPVDLKKCLDGLNLRKTLFIINSKTFTTLETLVNAKSVRSILLDYYFDFLNIKNEAKQKEITNEIIRHHFVASSSEEKLCSNFGIDVNNVFTFWNWVGGRYSVCSTIGVLPLSLCFGFEEVEKFLKGAESMDDHFLSADIFKNVPIMLGIIGFLNIYGQKIDSRAILPYAQALHKFAPHIQQLYMESNGKSVTNEGMSLSEATGCVVFGEPGTNGQHSFYQMIHQGRKIACEFIGYINSLNDIFMKDLELTNHDELMSNFFAQPDALAYGKTFEQVKTENEAKAPDKKDREDTLPHKVFDGNRPSISILFDELTPFSIGQLLSLYEHRVAVEGFIYGIDSFDQMGVELGKQLATNVRSYFKKGMDRKTDLSVFNSATANLLESYLRKRKKI